MGKNTSINSLEGLHVCFLAGTLGQGGAERQLYYILRALGQSGSQLSLITFTKGEMYEDMLRGLGVNIYYAGKPSSRLMRMLLTIKLVRKIKPDIIHSQHFYTNIYGAMASVFTGIPAIGSSRNNLEKEILAMGKLMGKLCFSLPHYFVANSMESVNIALRRGRKKNTLFYLPNAVDTVKFKPSEDSFDDDKVHLINIGRQVPWKRMDIIIRLAAKLKKAGKNIICHFIGDGPQHEELKSLSLLAGLSPNEVIFHGDIKNPEEILPKCDIFVYSSEYEGTPNVIIEAMACGLPVVSTPVGNLTYIIETGVNGFLVNVENGEDDFFATVSRLLSDVALQERIGARARQTIEDDFSFTALNRVLCEIYMKILKG